MHPTYRLLAAALLATLPLLAPKLAEASAAAPTQQQVIERFIAYSSYDPQFKLLPQTVKELLDQSGAPQELAPLILRAFKAEQARQAMSQQLSLGYDSGRYRTLIQRLEGGSIRKLREMEHTSYDPITRHEMKYFISRLADNPVPPKREALIKELLDANGATESAIRTRATLDQVIRELTATTPAEKGDANLNNTLKQNQALANSLRPSLEKETLNAALYTYRNASDEEIKQYIEFYNSPAGQWFSQTQHNGWLGALRNIGRSVAWQVQQPEGSTMRSSADDDFDL